MHSVTDRRTDGQQDYANSRSYCVAVRSAKNYRQCEHSALGGDDKSTKTNNR